MLSYQHFFHAGNHADVLKHLCWFLTLDYLNKKDKPYTLIDSHAGEGVYPAIDPRNKEKQTGVEKLQVSTSNPPLLNAYLAVLEHYADENQLPGSPAIASALMREGDCMHVIEKHPAAFGELSQWAKRAGNASVHTHNRDAFEGLVALCPPEIKRGAILIDPPYEQIEEYQWVVQSLKKVVKRWSQAQILVWYPLLGQRAKAKARACEDMINMLTQFADQNSISTCKVELCYTDLEKEPGMFGSGVLCLNPSWVFSETMQHTLPAVAGFIGPSATWSVTG